ncbi:hypothetical protein BC830DRAFT_1099582 [Chytriomyces sp. MP71]|nr:hypothetical protein BC830DRAFT_1099582 [Chytriomyces sp. MP71]
MLANQNAPPTSMLPTELLIEILTWVHPRDLVHLGQLSRGFNALLLSKVFAERSLERHLAPLPAFAENGTPLLVRNSYAPSELDRLFFGWNPSFQKVYILRRLALLRAIHWSHAQRLHRAHIPQMFGKLRNLQCLDLSFCRLGGLIPPALSTMAQLRILNLHKNRLVGPLPSSFGMLTMLESLDVSCNLLGGELPASLGNLHTLRHLLLNGNAFHGRIPHELGNLLLLETLRLQDNSFHGTVPGAFEALAHLEEVQLIGNDLNLHLPSQILRGTHVWRVLMANRLPSFMSLLFFCFMAAIYWDCLIEIVVFKLR